MKLRQSILIFALCMCFSGLHAQEERMQSVRIDTVVVKARRYTSGLRLSPGGTTTWSVRAMENMPKMLGTPNPMQYAQMLPGVQTNSEYRSGINIQGCENSHSLISSNGVTIYNPAHMLGLFSVFNASHYSTMMLNKSYAEASGQNRLGGHLDMSAEMEVSDSLYGEVMLGMAPQGTLHLPLGHNTDITVSLRGCDMNLLYDRWMNLENEKLKYKFYDSNFTLRHRIDDDDILLIDYYGGSDYGEFAEQKYQSNFNSSWGNYMGALHWKRDKRNYQLNSTLYSTNYYNHFEVKLPSNDSRLPSGIYDIGGKSEILFGGWKCSAEVIYHNIHPQRLQSDEDAAEAVANQHTLETFVSGAYTYSFAKWCSVNMGLKVPVYVSPDKTYVNADPSLNFDFNNQEVQLTLSYALKHQYIFQTGFSDIGLPTEFWLSSSSENSPLYCHSFNLSSSAYIFNRMFRVSCDLFLKYLYNQIEYNGNVFDFANKSYDVTKALLHSRGTNYGLSVMLQKPTGKITGWLSYTYTHAIRKFTELDAEDVYPASHERPHEVNLALTYNPDRHWSFSVMGIYASGTPFTAPTSLSIFNGNIISVYGKHNANRLRHYARLDASVNYQWKTRRGKEHGFSLSVYNVTSRRNDLFWRVVSNEEGEIAYRPVSFIVDFLPSLGYYFKF